MNKFLSTSLLFFSAIAFAAEEPKALEQDSIDTFDLDLCNQRKGISWETNEEPKTAPNKRKWDSINIFDDLYDQRIGGKKKRTKKEDDALGARAAMVAMPGSEVPLSAIPGLRLQLCIESDGAITARPSSTNHYEAFLKSTKATKGTGYRGLEEIEEFGPFGLEHVQEFTFMSKIINSDKKPIYLFKSLSKFHPIIFDNVGDIMGSVAHLLLQETSIKTFDEKDARHFRRLFPNIKGINLADNAPRSRFKINGITCYVGGKKRKIYSPNEARIECQNRIKHLFLSNLGENNVKAYYRQEDGRYIPYQPNN